jgi:hypothetical protein
VLDLLKIAIWATSSQKRSKKLWMSQGSILRSQNLNLEPRAKPAKNINLQQVARKSVIGPRILLGLILYAQNCLKLSRDPLKPCLLKFSNTCISLKMHGNQVIFDSEPSNHVLIMYLPHVGTNLLLNISTEL